MGMNLGQVLALECFSGAEVLAGRRGLGRAVRLVNVMEVPDISNWVTKNELILTTAYPFRDDPGALVALVEQLNQRQVSGIAIKFGRFVSALPADVLAAADRLGFPVISLPADAQFDRMIFGALSSIIEDDYVESKASENLAKRLQEAAMSGGSLTEVAQMLAGWCGGEVLIRDPEGRTLARAAARTEPSAAAGLVSYEKPVLFDGHLYAVIVLSLRNKAIDRVDLSLIDAAIPPIIMLLLRSSVQANIKKREDALSDLILGRMLLTPKNIRYVGSLGVDLTAPCTVCVLRADRQQDELGTLLGGAVARVMALAEEGAGLWPVDTRMQDCVVHLCFTERLDGEALAAFYEKIRAEVRRAAPALRLSVGIGGSIRETGQINAGFLQARQALELGERLSGPGIYRYEALSAQLLLARLPFDDALIGYVRRELGALIAYDRRMRTQFLPTLEMLLTQESGKAVSEQMFVHPKTIAYRKRTIERLLGVRLDSAGARARLLLAVTLYRLNAGRWEEQMFP